MSRSFKKTPVCNDHTTPGTCQAKRICDYRFYQTKRQAIPEWENERWAWRRRRAKTQEEWINHWEKFYRRK